MFPKIINEPLLAEADTPELVIGLGAMASEVRKYSYSLIYEPSTTKPSTVPWRVKFRVTQPYSAGAEVGITLNGNNIGTMRWKAFEAGPREATFLAPGMKLGKNIFQIQYRVAYGNLGNTKADILEATIFGEVLVANTNDIGVKPTELESGDWWKDLSKKIGESGKLIAAVVIVASLAVTAVYVSGYRDPSKWVSGFTRK